MNNISFRLVSFLLGLVALTVVSNTRAARAETPNTKLSVKLSEPVAAADREVSPIVTPVTTSESLAVHSTSSVVSSKLAAADREVSPIVTPVTTSESLAVHSTSSVVSSKLAAADREVSPTVTSVTIGEPLKNPSTVSLEPPKPAKVSLRETEPTKIAVATPEVVENHSSVSVELPKLTTAPVQVLKSAVTPVAVSEPVETHSPVSFETLKPSVAPVQAVEPVKTAVATRELLEKHSTVSLELPKPSAAPVQAVEPVVTPLAAAEPVAVNPTFTQIPEDKTGQANVQQAHLADSDKNQPDSQKLQPEVSKNDQLVSSKPVDASPVAKPIPGTLATSAALLTAPLQTTPQAKTSSNPADSTVAQTEIQPGQATRGGRSYIGIGGNIGFGDTGLGSGAFVINSKIGLTSFLSVRPAVLFGDDVNFLIPITYDFTIESDDPFAPVPFAPFVGGGLVVSTADGNNIGFLLTGGVDVPLSREFVANATLNIGFLEDSTDVGLTVGVGYTFPNFIR